MSAMHSASPAGVMFWFSARIAWENKKKAAQDKRVQSSWHQLAQPRSARPRLS